MVIQWYTVSIKIRYTKTGSNLKSSAFAIYSVRGYLYRLQKDFGHRIAFHSPLENLQYIEKLRPQQVLDIDLSWVGTKKSANVLIEKLHQNDSQSHHSWSIESISKPIKQSIDISENIDNSNEEVGLNFQTILPLLPQHSPFNGQVLLLLINNRFQQLFGFDAKIKDKPKNLTLLVHLWKRSESKNFSNSQNIGKSRKDSDLNNPKIIGRRGIIYLRGASSRLLQVLRILESLHLATKPSLTGWGHFKLVTPSRSFFDHKIRNRKQLATIVNRTLQENDVITIFSDDKPMSDEDITDLILNKLMNNEFPSHPSEASIIRKDNSEGRLVERFHPFDLIAQQHLLKILTDNLDSTLSETSIGFRPGRSRADAAKKIRECIRQGFQFALRTDIEQFFPTINHTQLLKCLDNWIPLADINMLYLIKAFVKTSYKLDDKIYKRSKGLAQGSPLSPLLTNLYLDKLDRKFEDGAFRAIRYADDILILTRSKVEAENALDDLLKSVGGLGLKLNTQKTIIIEISKGFDYLGEHFNNFEIEDPIQTLAAQKKPLILTESYLNLGINGDSIEIRRNGKLLENFPLRRISEIIILGRSTVSTALLEKCARFAIPISMALESGYQIAVITPDSRKFHKAATMHGEWYNKLSDFIRIDYAKEFVVAKINNTLSLMLNRHEQINSTFISQLENAKHTAMNASSMASLRGAEGVAARVNFKWIQTQILVAKPCFKSKRRERGGVDRLNSMLNFGYYLLYTRINALLRAHGLNPYLGILHDGKDDYETLVADFQEPFRCHVDRLVLRLINRNQITPNDFDQRGKKGYWLSRSAINCYINEFEKVMGERIGGIILRDALLAQIRAFRNLVTNKGSPFWLHQW